MYTRVLIRQAASSSAVVRSAAAAASSSSAKIAQQQQTRGAAQPYLMSASRAMSTAATGAERWRELSVLIVMQGRRHPTASSLGQGRNRDYRTPVVCGEGRRALSTGQQGATEGEEDRKAEDVQEEASAEGSAESDGDESEESVVGQLKQQVANGEKKQKELRDQAMYLAAEMENVRQIAKKDAEGSRLYAVQKFAKQLLDVADNLERAVESAKEGGGGGASLDTLLQGVEMTSDQLQKVFKSQGLEKFGEVGDLFDPHLHDAMFEMPVPDGEPGSVAQVLKVGYKLHDRVIRAAQVGTVKAA